LLGLGSDTKQTWRVLDVMCFSKGIFPN